MPDERFGKLKPLADHNGNWTMF